MSIASLGRAVLLFVVQTSVCLLLTAGIGALWALAGSGSFLHAFHVGLYVFGCVDLALGALGVGGVSPSWGFVSGAGATPGIFAGRLPAIKTDMWVPPDGTAVNATAILLFAGIALIAIAMVT